MSDAQLRPGPINAYLNSFLQEHTAALKNILAAYVLRAGLATGSNVPLVAEEIFQDTVLQVMDLGERFLAVQQPRTWFIRVALNVMQRRRAGLARRYRFEVLVSDLVSTAEIPEEELLEQLAVSALAGPEQAFETQEQVQEMLSLVSSEDARLLNLMVLPNAMLPPLVITWGSLLRRYACACIVRFAVCALPGTNTNPRNRGERSDMAKSPMNHHLSREKAVQRYLAALEEGDFSTIDAVWQEAQDNPALEHLLFALHEAFPNGQSLLDGNENALLKKELTMLKHDPVQEKETGSLDSFPSDQYPSARPRRRRATLMGTLAAILLVAFIVGGFLAVTNWNNSHLAHPRPTSTPAPSATPRPTQAPVAQLPPLCQVALPAAYQTNTSLNDLLVLSQNDIWLVGSDSQGQVLVLHWNGAQWSSTPMPAPAGSSLSKLAASSANDIWAIGETDYGSAPPGGGSPLPSHTLIEHWNGTDWSQVASPDLLPSTRNLLQGVTAIAPDNVWAVGAAGNTIAKSGYGPNTSPLVEHWDGARWQLVALPTIQSAGLNSVVALSANDVWAVGSSSPDNGNSQSPLIIHWDGQSWNQVETPAINGGAPGRLMKITADASHHLLALGFDQSNALLLSQSNSQWNALPVPPTANATNTAWFYNQFWDLTATSSQDIWLAGESVQVPKTGVGTSTPLVEHWDGKLWQSVPERYQGPANLQTISVSAGIIWSSGSIDDYGHPFLTTTCQ